MHGKLSMSNDIKKKKQQTVSNPTCTALLCCPFCGSGVSWCGCSSEGCHQVTCENCGNFDFANGVNDDGDTLKEMRESMIKKRNARAP